MLSVIRLFALAAIASAVELTQLAQPLTAAQAGALDLYLNTTSISNIMQTFVPLLSSYML